MNFVNLWKKKRCTLSFEYFPARNEANEAKLESVYTQLFTLKPDFVSVTFGAGGSSKEGSYNLIKKLIAQKKSMVVGYIAGLGLSQQEVSTIISQYTSAGVDALFCIRGDTALDNTAAETQPHEFPYARHLLLYTKKHSPLPLGVAGYPEGHSHATTKHQDWDFLKAKVDAGASFIISQYFYETHHFFTFVSECRKRGITVPILAGIMPIYSIKLTRNLSAQCGATLSKSIEQQFSTSNPDDKQALEDFGVALALDQCRELLTQGVDGLHFYTMDRSQSVQRIVLQLRAEGLLQ